MSKWALFVCLMAGAACFPAQGGDVGLIKSDLNFDRVVNLSDLAILSGEWLNSGEAYVPVTKPFPGPAELRCAQAQRVVVSAGQWETIFDLDDGPAIVTNFWMACDFNETGRKTPIRIYFDGHSTADIEGLTGELFGCGFYQPANFRGEFVGVTNSKHNSSEGAGYNGFSGYLRLLMPYYESIRIDIQNTSGYNPSYQSVWMMLERLPMEPNRLYCVGLKPGMYLRTHGYGEANNYTQWSEVTLFDSNEPTILAGVFQFFDNTTTAGGGGNWNYLEGDHRIYYNGSSTAGYRSSGCEDFFHSSWYFQEGLFDHSDECLVLKSNYRIAASRFFPLDRAPYGENGLKFTWQVGDTGLFSPGDPYLRWIVWYYQ